MTQNRWLRGFYLDLRSLALFRIALGSCLLVDLLLRLPLIDDFYTDSGVVPREAVLGQLEGSWAVSLHFISGQWAVQLLLFLLAILFALGFTLGYRTRLCAAASWFLVVSMHVRTPVILHGGDDLFRVLLFWCMFLPLNGRYSLDRALNPQAPNLSLAHLSPGSLALVFQLCAMYWYTAAEKMHPVWLTERSAVYYALNLEQFATPFGHFLLGYPEFLRLMTTATLVLEFLGPLVALSPVRTGPLRLLVIASFTAFHVGLGLSLRLGLFPWVCIAAWLAFLPPEFWSYVEGRFARARTWLEAHLRVPRILLRPELRPPAPVDYFGRVASLVVVAGLVLMEAGLSRRPTPGLERVARLEAKLLTLTQLGQTWRMFAPYPTLDDGWYVMEGITVGGKRFDIWHGGGAPDYAKPADFGALFRDSQWLKFLSNIWRKDMRGYRPYLGQYLCREWNERHEGADQVDMIYINYMLEFTPPPGQPIPVPTKELVHRHYCLEQGPA